MEVRSEKTPMGLVRRRTLRNLRSMALAVRTLGCETPARYGCKFFGKYYKAKTPAGISGLGRT